MVKKLRDKPVEDFNSSGQLTLDYLYEMEEWAHELEAHHIEEATELVKKLEESRARVDELLQKNNEYLERARATERLSKARSTIIDQLAFLTGSQQEEIEDLKEINLSLQEKLFQTENDLLLEKMQQPQQRVAIKAAFEECKWCTNPVIPGDSICEAHKKSHAEHSIDPNDLITKYKSHPCPLDCGMCQACRDAANNWEI